MKEIKNIVTTTYEVRDNFRVDIVILPNEFEAWIYQKDNGYKSFMFGLCKNQPDAKDGETYITYDRFIEIVENNLDEYIDSYIDDMDGIEQYHESQF